jgi:hypothetical protein
MAFIKTRAERREGVCIFLFFLQLSVDFAMYPEASKRANAISSFVPAFPSIQSTRNTSLFLFTSFVSPCLPQILAVHTIVPHINPNP